MGKHVESNAERMQQQYAGSEPVIYDRYYEPESFFSNYAFAFCVIGTVLGAVAIFCALTMKENITLGIGAILIAISGLMLSIAGRSKTQNIIGTIGVGLSAAAIFVVAIESFSFVYTATDETAANTETANMSAAQEIDPETQAMLEAEEANMVTFSSYSSESAENDKALLDDLLLKVKDVYAGTDPDIKIADPVNDMLMFDATYDTGDENGKMLYTKLGSPSSITEMHFWCEDGVVNGEVIINKVSYFCIDGEWQ